MGNMADSYQNSSGGASPKDAIMSPERDLLKLAAQMATQEHPSQGSVRQRYDPPKSPVTPDRGFQSYNPPQSFVYQNIQDGGGMARCSDDGVQQVEGLVPSQSQGNSEIQDLRNHVTWLSQLAYQRPLLTPMHVRSDDRQMDVPRSSAVLNDANASVNVTVPVANMATVANAGLNVPVDTLDNSGNVVDSGDGNVTSDVVEPVPRFYEGIPILEAFHKPEPVGVPVGEYWAKTANKAFNANLGKEKLQDLKKEYVTPANLPFAKAPTVYDNIWHKMNPIDRSIDAKQQKVQSAFSVATVPLLRAAELVNVNGNIDKRQVLAHIGAAVAFLGDASYSISAARREHVKALLHKDYRSLCSKDIPITSKLLGEDCDVRIKKIKESSRAPLMAHNYPVQDTGNRQSQSYQSSQRTKNYNNSGADRSKYGPRSHGRQSYSDAGAYAKQYAYSKPRYQGFQQRGSTFKRPFRR
jgi:hypothetical protein